MVGGNSTVAGTARADRSATRESSAAVARLTDRLRAALSSTWTLGAIVFLVTWGGGAVAPATGLDNSSHAGLNLGTWEGLQYGRDLVFSYGPLGFLKSQMVFYADLARLAAVYGAALHLAVSLSLVWATRRNFPLPVAVALALVAAVLLRGDSSSIAVKDDASVVVLAFIWCLAALGTDPPPWVTRLVVIGGGPFAAIEILAKLNTGVVVLTLVAVTVVAIRSHRARNVAILAGSFAGSVAVLWFASGQGIDTVGGFVSGTRELVSGYSSGARLEFGTRGYDYVLAPAVIAAAAAIAWISTGRLPTGRRAVVLVLVAFVAFTAFKAGFVSHEIFHMAIFFPTILGVCLAFRLPDRPAVRIAALVAIVAVAAAAFTPRFEGYPMLDPLDNASDAVSTAVTLADTGRLENRIEDGRAAMQAEYALDPRTRRSLGDHPVHVDPSEAGAAWAYGLNWRPLPVFQPYAAWTPELDRRNADAVASADGPARILRRNENPLGRYRGFESPAAMIAMLCNFRPLRTTEQWQLLGRIDDRCGEPRPLGTVTGQYGTPIRVPRGRPGNVVFARVHGVQVSGVERVESFLYRARSRGVRLNDRGYVLVPGTADDGLLLRAPPRLDYPAPFALAPNAAQITFLLDNRPSSDRIEVDFYEMPVARAPAAGRSGA